MTNRKDWNYTQNTVTKNTKAITLTNNKGEQLLVYYSYDTIVAFEWYGDEDYLLCITQNEWKQTTGKHLNWIDDDKSRRIPHKNFMKLYREIEKEFGEKLYSEYE